MLSSFNGSLERTRLLVYGMFKWHVTDRVKASFRHENTGLQNTSDSWYFNYNSETA